MGKTVVGIFAIALLQVAFLGFTAIDAMRNAPLNEVSPPVWIGHELARLDNTPEFPAPEVVELRPNRRVHFAATNRSRSRYRTTRPTHHSTFTSLESIVTNTIVQSGPGIASGHTMVLVDYSPDVLIDGRPKEIRFR